MPRALSCDGAFFHSTSGWPAVEASARNAQPMREMERVLLVAFAGLLRTGVAILPKNAGYLRDTHTTRPCSRARCHQPGGKAGDRVQEPGSRAAGSEPLESRRLGFGNRVPLYLGVVARHTSVIHPSTHNEEDYGNFFSFQVLFLEAFPRTAAFAHRTRSPQKGWKIHMDERQHKTGSLA